MKRAVVIPTHNESGNIGGLVARLRELQYDVLVVDDRGTDDTAAIVAALAERDAAIHLIARVDRRGYASALQEGWRWALDHGYEQIGQMDADGNHDPAALPALFRLLDDADLAIGSRYCAGGTTPDFGFVRRAMSRLAGVCARWFLSLPLTDPTAGFRTWRAELLRRVLSASLVSEGFVVLVESAWLSHKFGATIREAPIVFRARKAGKSNLSMAIALEWFRVVVRLRRRAIE